MRRDRRLFITGAASLGVILFVRAAAGRPEVPVPVPSPPPTPAGFYTGSLFQELQDAGAQESLERVFFDSTGEMSALQLMFHAITFANAAGARASFSAVASYMEIAYEVPNSLLRTSVEGQGEAAFQAVRYVEPMVDDPQDVTRLGIAVIWRKQAIWIGSVIACEKEPLPEIAPYERRFAFEVKHGQGDPTDASALVPDLADMPYGYEVLGEQWFSYRGR